MRSAGAVVAEIHSLPVLTERVAAAQAAIATREAALAQTRSQVTALTEADTELAVAQAAEDLAVRQLDRGLVPRSALDLTTADAVRASRKRAEIRRQRLMGGDAPSEVAVWIGIDVNGHIAVKP